jgi:hypothetical protein
VHKFKPFFCLEKLVAVSLDCHKLWLPDNVRRRVTPATTAGPLALQLEDTSLISVGAGRRWAKMYRKLSLYKLAAGAGYFTSK